MDSFLASAVGSALDIVVPEAEAGGAESVDTPPSPLLSLLSRPGSTGIRGMRIALLVGDTVDIEQVAIARDIAVNVAPVSVARSCQGTMLEWCSSCVTTISSPVPSRFRP